MSKILTIFVPTFERKDKLERLLKMIVMAKNINYFNLLVQNNNIKDYKTVNLLSKYQNKFPEWEFISNHSNIGAEANIIEGLKKVKTKYCWIIGDDDLPMNGLIDNVLDLLIKNEILLLFIKPFWTKNIEIFKDKKLLHNFRERSALEITKEANIMTTFISSWIFNFEEYKKIDPELKHAFQRIGNQFPQLSWILPLLNIKGKYLSSKKSSILATSENTNSYKVLETFLYLLPETIYEISNNKKINELIIKSYCRSYLPRLIFSVRAGFFPKTTDKNFLKISKYLKKFLIFRIICIPCLFLSNFVPPHLIKLSFLIIKKLKIAIFKL